MASRAGFPKRIADRLQIRGMMTTHCKSNILILAILSACLPAPAQTPPGEDPSLIELQRGNDEYAAHKYTYALRSYLNANRFAHDPCVKCYVGLSQTYVAMKDWRNAAAMADKALAIATTDKEKAQAHNLKGTAYLALSSQDASNLPLAEEEYRAAIQADPSMPPYHFSLGVMLLKESHDAEAVQELRRFLELAPEDPKGSIVRQWIANPRHAMGLFAPEFHATSAQGDEISLASLKGKIAVLDFWATWCAPCREALPELKDLAKKYPPDRFVLISVSQDEDHSQADAPITRHRRHRRPDGPKDVGRGADQHSHRDQMDRQRPQHRFPPRSHLRAIGGPRKPMGHRARPSGQWERAPSRRYLGANPLGTVPCA